jgi:hypothetical protein
MSRIQLYLVDVGLVVGSNVKPEVSPGTAGSTAAAGTTDDG